MHFERPSFRRVSCATGLALIGIAACLLLIPNPVALIYFPVVLWLGFGFLILAYLLRWARALQTLITTRKKIKKQREDLKSIYSRNSPHT
jgi:Flp pilus assembly protein TadB